MTDTERIAELEALVVAKMLEVSRAMRRITELEAQVERYGEAIMYTWYQEIALKEKI